MTRATRPKAADEKHADRCVVGTIDERLASAVTAVVEARARATESPLAYRRCLAEAILLGHSLARSARRRLHAARDPKEKWEATLSMAQHGLCLVFLLAEQARQNWIAGGPREPVDRLSAHVARLSGWLQSNGVIVGAHVAARRGDEIDERDRIDAIQAAVRYCQPHPGRAIKPASKAERESAEKDKLAIVAAATECIDNLKPSDTDLRRVLSTELDRQFEDALLIRPKTPNKEQRVRAPGLSSEAPDDVANRDGEPRRRDAKNVSRKTNELVDLVDLARFGHDLHEACAAKGRATLAALDYFVRKSSGSKVTLASVAADFDISVKALRCDQPFVGRQIQRLRQRVV